jgi:hypothetical protein
MKLSTAIRTLDSQAAWLGITAAELLADIAQHGRRVYSERVVLAYTVYQDSLQLEQDVARLEAERDDTIDTVVS